MATMHELQTAFLSGAMAGLCTDLVLFPVDTIKTRLQSSAGLRHSGGLRSIYSGLGAVAARSMPSAALFFCSYEGVKRMLGCDRGGRMRAAGVQMLAAVTGEVTACLVRVPSEVVKQRAQVTSGTTSFSVLSGVIRTNGLRGLYQGYTSTVLREIPFALLQFPLWELLKWTWGQGNDVGAWQSAVCGAIAGGSAAAMTTPLDVAKTRIMLAPPNSQLAAGQLTVALRLVWLDKGVAGLFAGIVPRVTMIAIGGAIFLGVYDKMRISLNLLEQRYLK